MLFALIYLVLVEIYNCSCNVYAFFITIAIIGYAQGRSQKGRFEIQQMYFRQNSSPNTFS